MRTFLFSPINQVGMFGVVTRYTDPPWYSAGAGADVPSYHWRGGNRLYARLTDRVDEIQAVHAGGRLASWLRGDDAKPSSMTNR